MNGAANATAKSDAAKIKVRPLPPLTLAEWAKRNLPPPDFLMGNWLSTTSRAILSAPTGLGKTNFVLALGFRIAAGLHFLHWKGRRRARVLYIDGEMSRRLLKQRLADEAARLGTTQPEAFFTLSREDVEDFRPLNTPDGTNSLLAFIKEIGGVDLVIFDSVMCLLTGSMAEEEPWAMAMPLVRELTRRNITQLWVHHTGYDKSRGYGTSTRDWQLDTGLHLEAVERPDTDVSFRLRFQKARERTPETRCDFQDVEIALVNDIWVHRLTEAERNPKHISPAGRKFFDAVTNALAGDDVATSMSGQRPVTNEVWMREAEHLGLIDSKATDNTKRALLSKYRRELVAANRVACEEKLTWILR